jgi:hypothetical protein
MEPHPIYNSSILCSHKGRYSHVKLDAHGYILLGPPGCAQVFPYLSPGPLDLWWYEKNE